jgi:hypothetical protein
MSVGELFILGFFGKAIPAWLRQFAARYGLGAIEQGVQDGTLARSAIRKSIDRVRQRKALLI